MNYGTFISYTLLGTFTPGPNNIMAMSNSARAGLRRGLVFSAGVLVGFSFILSLCALLTSMLYQYVPVAAPVMKWIGAAYILFLAFTILRDKPHANKEQALLRPDGFWTGVVMQFVNMKGILYGITTFSSFILPYTQSPSLLAAAVVCLALAAFISCCCWSIFGSLLQQAYEQYKKWINLAMELLLVYCAVMSVL